MIAIVIKPFNDLQVVEIENELSVFQKLVDGYVEPIYKGDYIFLVNEEGLIMNLPQNILGLVGNVVIVRNGGSEFEGLTDNDIKYIKELI